MPGAGSAAPVEQLGRTAVALEPFLGSGGPVLQAPVELVRGVTGPAHRRPHLLRAAESPVHSGRLVRSGPARPVHFPRWTQIGPREHHLGTPPPAQHA